MKWKFADAVVSHSREILSAVAVGVLVTVISGSLLDGEDASNIQPDFRQPDATYRNHFVRANLAQVVSALSPVKMAIAEYYGFSGKLPSDQSEIDLSIYDLLAYDLIEDAVLTAEGKIEIELSDDFGINKYLSMAPLVSEHGAHITWQCMTNIEKVHLGSSVTRFCEHQERP
jgi:hypothetical protein